MSYETSDAWIKTCRWHRSYEEHFQTDNAQQVCKLNLTGRLWASQLFNAYNAACHKGGVVSKIVGSGFTFGVICRKRNNRVFKGKLGRILYRKAILHLSRIKVYLRFIVKCLLVVLHVSSYVQKMKTEGADYIQVTFCFNAEKKNTCCWCRTPKSQSLPTERK